MKRKFRQLLNFSSLLILMIAITSAVLVQAKTPAKDFSAGPASGPAPLAMQFSDEIAWARHFGDRDLLASWKQLTSNAAWPARGSFPCVVLPNGHIVLMGGAGAGGSWGANNDVWRSEDGGKNWTLVNSAPGWTERYGHTSVVLSNGNIVLMGGITPGPVDVPRKNDVWRSTNGGDTWDLLTDNAPWSPRYRHSSVVLLNGDILLMGGDVGSPLYFSDEIWRSTNGGANWSQVNVTGTYWSGRTAHTSVVLANGDIVLIGGVDDSGNIGYKSDVWLSETGGESWTRLVENAGWSTRWGHTSVVLPEPDGRLVLMGGESPEFGYMNDVWVSENDGATWMKLMDHAGWSGRWMPASVVLSSGHILLLGGYDNDGYMNDVWASAEGTQHYYLPMILR